MEGGMEGGRGIEIKCLWGGVVRACVLVCLFVCTCVCTCARARACICVCVCVSE